MPDYPVIEIPTGDDSGSTSTTSSSTSSSSSSSTSTSTGPSDADRFRAQIMASYREIIRRWGLPASKNLLNLMERGARARWSTTQFMDMLRHTPEYRQNFRGIRWRTGMTEGQYLSTFAQYKAAYQDVGGHLTRRQFGRLLKKGVTYEEFGDRVAAVQSMRTYQPMWQSFLQALELNGIEKNVSRKALGKFIMGLGPVKFERLFQEAYATTQLEEVAGIEVTAPRAGETATPDSYGLTRKALLNIIRQAEALNPGFEVEKLSGQEFAAIGADLREHDINYMQRYGLSTAEYIKMRFGGPGAAETADLSKRILATQEAFLEPRAVQATALTARSQQPGAGEDELPQSL